MANQLATVILKFRYLKILATAVFVSGLTRCQTVRETSNLERMASSRKAQEKKENAWIKQQGLVQATSEEVAVGRAGEVRFEGTKASIPGRSLSVVFKMGAIKPVEGVGISGLFTTTSFYELKSTRTGKSLLKSASTITTTTRDENGFKQGVYVSQDGTRLLIHETWCGADGAHDTYALATKVSEHDVWDLKYLKLPEFTGIDGIPEHGPVPVGFAGDDLIFRPLLSGGAYKKKLADIEAARNPLPFTRG